MKRNEQRGMDAAKKMKFSLRGNNKMDLDSIKRAINDGDIQLIYEFINDKAILDEFVNGDPRVFYEILSSTINVDRGKLALDNVNETYDDLILQFIKASKEVHLGFFDGYTLLMWSLMKRMSYKIIDELIKAGSDINAASNSTSMTPLMYAFSGENSKDTIIELINRGADISSQDHGRCTPLFYGMEYYHHDPDFIAMLLKAGSNVHNLDDEGRNILMIDNCQCLDGDDCKTKESIDVLLQYGIDDTELKGTDNDGNTVLHLTFCKYVFDLALKSGVSVDAKNNEGQTPLVKGIEEPYYHGKVVYLSKCGANVNSTDPELQTALHLCCTIIDDFVRSKTMDVLIYHGGNIHARNINNQTPLDLIIKSSDFYGDEVFIVIPMHIILFEDNGFDFGKEVLEMIACREYDSSFIGKCRKELNLMRETFIKDGLTFYEFCILKRYYKSKCVNIPLNEYKYSCSEIRQLFPIYENVIIIRIKDNRLKKGELDLRKRFENITMRSVDSMKNDFGVDLNYDCFYHISKYLNYKEMFNIFSAAIES